MKHFNFTSLKADTHRLFKTTIHYQVLAVLQLYTPQCKHTTQDSYKLAVTVFLVEASWKVMAHAQKPDFFFRQNGRVHLNQRWLQFSRLLTAEVCT